MRRHDAAERAQRLANKTGREAFALLIARETDNWNVGTIDSPFAFRLLRFQPQPETATAAQAAPRTQKGHHRHRVAFR